MNEEIATELLRKLGVAATETNIGYVIEAAATVAPAPKKKAPVVTEAPAVEAPAVEAPATE